MLLLRDNPASGVWAVFTHQSTEIEKTLKARGLTSRGQQLSVFLRHHIVAAH